jgi:TP901 family phage tail tape measure protein
VSNAVFFDIIPRIVGMSAESAKLVKESGTAGGEAGKSFGEAFSQWATGSAGEMSAAMTSQVTAATTTLERASASIVKAKDAEADASGRVMIAEAKLNEARQKYATESSQVVAAEQRLEVAKRKQIAASADVVAAVGAEGRAQETLTAKQDAAAASTGSVAKSLSTAGLALTAGYAVAIGVAANAAGDFQQTQERLVTTAGESRDNLDMVSQGVLDMAGQVGYSADEISKGMYTVESAGEHGADALTVMKAAAQGARAEGAELTTVTDAVTTALHDYSLGADQSALITSKMVTAVGEGKTTFEQFAGSLHSVQPIAAAAGISINDLYGTLASMTASGESADQATEHMADAIRHLSNVTSPMNEELSQLGVNTQDIQQHLGDRGIAGSMQAISEAVKSHMNPEMQVSIDAFNHSAIAAQDAKTAFDHLDPAIQAMAQSYMDGGMSARDFTKQSGTLGEANKTQATQWLAAQQKVDGFSGAIKSGKSAIQTYQSAMALATGDMSSLDVALMVTGDYADKTHQNITDIANATTEADGSVKGWHDTQETFNQKMAEFKDGLGATVIEIGTDFLPVLTDIVGGLKDGAQWLGSNKWALDALVTSVGIAAGSFVAFKTASAVWAVMNIGIEASSAAMGVFAVAEDGAAVSAGGLAAALAATGISEIVIGITALVAGVIALGAGVKYAYDHWSWFHTAVQSSWEVLKAVGSWIGSAFASAWHGLVTAFDTVRDAVSTVSHVVSDFWTAHVSPVISATETGFKYLAAIVATIFIAPFVIAFNLAKSVVLAWWHDAVEPALHAVGDVFSWLNDTIIQPIISIVVARIHDFGDVMSWLYDHGVKPSMDAIGDIWNWLYNTVIKPVVGFIKDELTSWGDTFQHVYDAVIKVVSAAIKLEMDGIKNVFSDTVNWIETQWNRIHKIVETPAKFIVDAVYNHGILPVWNDIAGVFGLSQIQPVDVGSWDTYAGGGIIPGYRPGKDEHPAMLSAGESILTPEATNLLGPDFIYGINGLSGRKPGGANGGMIHADGGFFGGVGDFLSGAWKDVKDTTGFLAKMATDPVAELKDLFSSAIDKTNDTPGEPSKWLDAVKSTPGKFLDAAVDKIKSWFASNPSAGKSGTGTPYNGPIELDKWLTDATIANGFDPAHWVPGMKVLAMRESGGDPNAINNWDSNAAAGHPSQGLTQTIPSTFEAYRNPKLPDNILDPTANAAASENYIVATYGDINNVQQADANASPKGYAGGGIIGPILRDTGGPLPPGRSIVDNLTGKDELVLTPDEKQLWEQIVNGIKGSGIGTAVANAGSSSNANVAGSAPSGDLPIALTPEGMDALNGSTGSSSSAPSAGYATPGTNSVANAGGAAQKPRTMADVNAEYGQKAVDLVNSSWKEMLGTLGGAVGGVFIQNMYSGDGQGRDVARQISREMNAHAGSGSR